MPPSNTAYPRGHDAQESDPFLEREKPNQVLLRLAAGYRVLLIGIATIMPALAIAYLYQSVDPTLRYSGPHLHEVAILVAVALAAFIGWVTYQSYRAHGEHYLRYVALAFFSFAIVYAPHGILTYQTHDHLVLFLIFGPVSRILMAGYLLAALLRINLPDDPAPIRQSRRRWVGHILAFLAMDLMLFAVVSQKIHLPVTVIRTLETLSLGILMTSLLVMLFVRVQSRLLQTHTIALLFFVQASAAFLLSKPWNHLWWLAHGISATGFLLLGYAIMRAYETTASFRWVYSERELFEQLRQRTGELEAVNQILEKNQRDLEQTFADYRVAQHKAREADARLAQVLAVADDAIMTVDGNFRIKDFNHGAETIFGYRSHEAIGQPIQSLIPHHFTESQLHQAEEFAISSPPSCWLNRDGGDTLGRRSDGRTFPAEASITQLITGEDILYIVILRDVSERKRAEGELRIAAAAFEAQEGMIVTNAEGLILRVNRAFTDITGYYAGDVVGHTPRLLKSGHHDAAFYAAMWDSVQRLNSWQGEIWNRRQSGEMYPAWLTITAVRDDRNGVTHYVGTLTDITERKAAEDAIKHLAFYDPLTHLPNRRLLLDRLHQAVAANARNPRKGALLFIDLDHFKTLNDTLGHDQGDRLLQRVAQRLIASVRENDTVARLGGDEFVVMLEDLSENPQHATTQAKIVGEKILASLNQPYSLAGHKHHSTPSIGVTLFGGHQKIVEELLKQADIAMYAAKAAGRNTVRFFEPDNI